MYRGHPIHAQCNLGIRAYLRVIKGDSAEEKKEKLNCAQFPETWREPITPFLSADCRKDAIAAKRIEMEERNEEFKKESRLVDDKEMTKKSYKKFMKDEDSMSSDEASQNFDAEVDRQEIKLQNGRGRAVVMVAEFDVRQRSEGGTRDSKATVKRALSPSRANSSFGGSGHNMCVSWECWRTAFF
jgi:hypothetical protein